MTKGIDVSVYQGNIEWNKVKADSIDFAILRAGYGREFSQKDAKFERNYAGCLEHDISVGAYWYSYALTPEDAKKRLLSASNLLKTRHLNILYILTSKTKHSWHYPRICYKKSRLLFVTC